MRYVIDEANSEINWRGFLPGTSLTGRVMISEGTIETDESNRDITGGRLLIDMNSIEPLDNQLDAGNRRKLANELKSDNFFDTSVHPVAEFRILEVNVIGERVDSCNIDGVIQPTHEVTGDLTLKGIKNRITVLMHITISGKKLTAQSMFTLDRSQWHIDHLIERANGNKRVLPDMEIMVKVVAETGEALPL